MIESYFAEGHKPGYVDKLLDIEHIPRDDDPIYKIPDRDPQKSKDGAEEKDKDAEEEEKEKGGEDKTPSKQQKPTSPKVHYSGCALAREKLPFYSWNSFFLPSFHVRVAANDAITPVVPCFCSCCRSSCMVGWLRLRWLLV